jgi:hypothetical protein
LIRDLAQVATPSGEGAPLRGAAFGDVTVIDDAYVLCEDGRVVAVGRMRDLERLGEDVEEIEGRGRSAIGLSCRTHACLPASRRRVLAASSGASGELHATGSAPLDRAGNAAAGPDAYARPSTSP